MQGLSELYPFALARSSYSLPDSLHVLSSFTVSFSQPPSPRAQFFEAHEERHLKFSTLLFVPLGKYQDCHGVEGNGKLKTLQGHYNLTAT